MKRWQKALVIIGIVTIFAVGVVLAFITPLAIEKKVREKIMEEARQEKIHEPLAWVESGNMAEARKYFEKATEAWQLVGRGGQYCESDRYLSLAIYYQNQEIITLLRRITEEGK